MLEPILGSVNSERVLLYLLAREQGYAREIARFFGSDPDSIQKQLVRLEQGGILIARQAGRTILYQFNPRYPFLQQLQDLLRRALDTYPEKMREELVVNRRRPRRRGKPL